MGQFHAVIFNIYIRHIHHIISYLSATQRYCSFYQENVLFDWELIYYWKSIVFWQKIRETFYLNSWFGLKTDVGMKSEFTFWRKIWSNERNMTLYHFPKPIQCSIQCLITSQGCRFIKHLKKIRHSGRMNWHWMSVFAPCRVLVYKSPCIAYCYLANEALFYKIWLFSTVLFVCYCIMEDRLARLLDD